jgi:hypothetical protein
MESPTGQQWNGFHPPLLAVYWVNTLRWHLACNEDRIQPSRNGGLDLLIF